MQFYRGNAVKKLISNLLMSLSVFFIALANPAGAAKNEVALNWSMEPNSSAKWFDLFGAEIRQKEIQINDLRGQLSIFSGHSRMKIEFAQAQADFKRKQKYVIIIITSIFILSLYFYWARWRKHLTLPDFNEYKAKNGSNKCYTCGHTSVRLWFFDPRSSSAKIHICNTCGTSLWRS